MVDFQNDFCRPSTPDQDRAQTRANAEAARRANAFAGEAARLGTRVIYSQQISDPVRLTPRQRRRERDSQLCLAGSPGAELFIEPVPGSRIARKYRYDIWQSQEFLEALSDWDIDGLIIGGVELTCGAERASTRSHRPGVRDAQQRAGWQQPHPRLPAIRASIRNPGRRPASQMASQSRCAHAVGASVSPRGGRRVRSPTCWCRARRPGWSGRTPGGSPTARPYRSA